MEGVRGIVLAIRFLCELGLLAALAFWGFTVGDGGLAWVLGLGAPALSALVWGTFIAPKARRPLPPPVRLSVEIDLFVLAAVALWFASAPEAGVALGAAGVSTSVLNFATEVRTPS